MEDVGRASGRKKPALSETEGNGLINNRRSLSLWWWAEGLLLLLMLDFHFTPLVHPSSISLSNLSTPSCPPLALVFALPHACCWHSQHWQLGRFSSRQIILSTACCLCKNPQQESGIIWLGAKNPGPDWLRNLKRNTDFFMWNKDLL